jgi:glucose/arabinose dehydrogenase
MELNPAFTNANLPSVASLNAPTGLKPLQGTATGTYLQTENILQSLQSSNTVSPTDFTSLVSTLNRLFGNDSDPGIPTLPTTPGTGNGLKGEYFDNADFTNPIATQVDPLINFNWWTGAPTSTMGSDTFSVRWTGQIQPVFSETYTFYTRADDGVRLLVNNQELISGASDTVTERQGSIALEAGKKYDIQLDFVEDQGVAISRLLWSSPSQAQQIIPTSQLYSGSVSTPPPINPPALPALSIDSPSIAEGSSGTATNLGFTVNLSAASATPVSVNYATANGTALADFDYTPISGTLTFAPGETSKILPVPVIGDSTVEPDETFTLNLSSPTNATIAIAQGTGTILNDDQPQPVPTLAVDNITITEGNTGTTNAVFTVTMTGFSDSPVNVSYATADGTAIAGSDYTATSGGLTFNPNDRTKTITVPIIGDTTLEPDETFFVRLSNPTSATIAVGQGIGTIVNDDSQAPLPSSISLNSVATGLNGPTDIVNAGDGSGRLFVAQQNGTIRVVRNGILEEGIFLDIRDRVIQSGGEQGLLSIAFPPNYIAKGYFYVYYNNLAGDVVLSRFRLAVNDQNSAAPISEQILLTIPHRTFTNHNGGKLAFNPADGYLYVSVGDGGGGGDPSNNAQNPAVLLGKILRLDVETPTTAPYLIPITNPFTATTDPSDLARDEIWATGLRNPWRISFDRQTNNLYIADVGQGAREEVNFQPVTSRGGENYGWKIMEGNLPFSAGSTAGLTPPLLEYDHSSQGGLSITGGYVYRGPSLPSLNGAYLYGDFVNGKIWGARRTTTGELENKLLIDSTLGISTFGEDESGEIYVADYFSGGLFKVGL